jgi:Domain of unknown function (DUF6894)
VPRFYFHLSNSDECIRDDIGCDVSDLAAAHFRAKELACRLTALSGLAYHKPDWQRWTVTVKDDCRGPVLTVIFAPCSNGSRRFGQELRHLSKLVQHIADFAINFPRPSVASLSLIGCQLWHTADIRDTATFVCC